MDSELKEKLKKFMVFYHDSLFSLPLKESEKEIILMAFIEWMQNSKKD